MTVDRLEQLARAWSTAAQTWDPSALAALYAPDGLLFGGRDGHCVGTGEIRAYFESYVGVIQSASLQLFDQQVRDAGPAALLAQGFAEFSFVLAAGRRTRSRMRTTWLLDWTSGETRIRAHHFSPVPESSPLGR